jgi:HTH-type transcriptional regulator, sugar sensing transcriptional regulator
LGEDQVLKTLNGLGLSRLDSQVYICLAKKGSQKGNEISKTLKVQNQQLYRSLKNLRSKGIVDATLEHPARFSAVSFDKVVDLFIKAKMAEAQLIQEKKEEILTSFQSIAVRENADSAAKFSVIEGRGYIYSKILQMIKETKNQFSTITTVAGLLRVDQFGLFDAVFSDPPKSKPQFRFLTELSVQSIGVMKKVLGEMKKTKFGFEGRTPELGLGLFPQMVIRDEAEAIFFITPPANQNDTCLWTNCRSLVNAFSAIFEDLWRNATDLNKKMAEIETGKLKSEPLAASNVEAARRKYYKALESAEKEIIMIGSEDLIRSSRSLAFLEDPDRNVSAKIMAPITTRNWAIAQQLSKYCEVKHIPAGYLNTTVVDGKHVFQFRNSRSTSQEKEESSSHFENMFYSDDYEYLDKTNKLLGNIWINAPALSPVTLENILAPPIDVVEPVSKFGFDPLKKISGVVVADVVQDSTKLTEKEVIAKIISAQKKPPAHSDNIVRLYYQDGQAVIHPPSHLNLPDMLFYCVHAEKHSTYGTQDFMHIMVRRETPFGYAYVPSVFVYDNSAATEYWKKYFAGVPSGSNLQLVNNDELQVQLHGNILFAVWSIPIMLMPQLFTLPPGCIMLGGYGNLKTETHTLNLVSGYKMVSEYNGFNAFVTFLHPSSNYSGPGTDGFLCREVISTIYPPKK